MLAIEVLSRSTERVDRMIKRQLHMARGVAEYWTVKLDARAIEVFALGSQVAWLAWQPITGQALLTLTLPVMLRSITADRRN